LFYLYLASWLGSAGFDQRPLLLGDEGTYFVGGHCSISASLNGDPVGNVPGIKTTDRWANALIEIGLRF
jgi:hypothetical protein